MKGSKVEIYVPILLRLANDHINYSIEEENYFQSNILVEENGIVEIEKSMRLGNDICFRHSIKNFYVHDNYDNIDYKQKYKDLLKNIEVFYSGKRIILKYIFINDGNIDFDDLYSFILINVSGIVREKFILRYNRIVRSKKADINNKDEKTITMYYSYVVSIIKNDKHILNNVENYYKQYAYKVTENKNGIFSKRKEHFINIDDKKTVIFCSGNASEYFKSIIINYVYMYILQYKKLSDNSNENIYKDINLNTGLDENIINKYNKIDEQQLIIFCNNAMNLLGDKI